MANVGETHISPEHLIEERMKVPKTRFLKHRFLKPGLECGSLFAKLSHRQARIQGCPQELKCQA